VFDWLNGTKEKKETGYEKKGLALFGVNGKHDFQRHKSDWSDLGDRWSFTAF